MIKCITIGRYKYPQYNLINRTYMITEIERSIVAVMEENIGDMVLIPYYTDDADMFELDIDEAISQILKFSSEELFNINIYISKNISSEYKKTLDEKHDMLYGCGEYYETYKRITICKDHVEKVEDHDPNYFYCVYKCIYVLNKNLKYQIELENVEELLLKYPKLKNEKIFDISYINDIFVKSNAWYAFTHAHPSFELWHNYSSIFNISLTEEKYLYKFLKIKLNVNIRCEIKLDDCKIIISFGNPEEKIAEIERISIDKELTQTIKIRDTTRFKKDNVPENMINEYNSTINKYLKELINYNNIKINLDRYSYSNYSHYIEFYRRGIAFTIKNKSFLIDIEYGYINENEITIYINHKVITIPREKKNTTVNKKKPVSKSVSAIQKPVKIPPRKTIYDYYDGRAKWYDNICIEDGKYFIRSYDCDIINGCKL